MTGVEVTVAQLEAVLAIDEHRSFTAAGRALGLTQSAVSRTIGTLERRLGARVVHRDRGGARLTALGDRVAVHARAVAHHLDAVADLTADPAHQVRVGTVVSANVTLLPAATERLRARHPAWRVWSVEGDDDELAGWYAAGAVELAISTWPSSRFHRDGDTSAGHVALTDTFLAVLPAGHPLAAGRDVGLADLVAAGVADPGGSCSPELDAGYRRHGLAWEPAHIVRSIDTVVAMATAGISAGVLPALAAPEAFPPTVALRPLRPTLTRQVHIHHRATPASTALAEALAAAAPR